MAFLAPLRQHSTPTLPGLLKLHRPCSSTFPLINKLNYSIHGILAASNLLIVRQLLYLPVNLSASPEVSAAASCGTLPTT